MPEERPSLPLDVMIAFEFGLALLAIIIGFFIGFDPLRSIPRGLASLPINLWHMVLGATLALPLLVFFVTLDRYAAKLVESIRDVLMESIAPSMAEAGWAGRAVVSLGAGVGEEVLFRGLLQGGLTQWWGLIPALIVASLLFGIVHWVNAPYLAFATAIGVVFGLLFIYTGSLVAPITMHAVYDFLALNRLVSDYAKETTVES